MIPKLTYQNKLYIVIGVIILCLTLLYVKKVKPIINLKNQLDSFDPSLKESLFIQEHVLIQKINKIDEFLLKDLNANGVQQKLITDISNQTNLSIKIAGVSGIKIQEINNYKGALFYIECKGDYSSLLKTLYHIERNIKYVKIISTKFYTSNLNSINKQKELYGKFYFQSVQYEK